MFWLKRQRYSPLKRRLRPARVAGTKGSWAVPGQRVLAALLLSLLVAAGIVQPGRGSAPAQTPTPQALSVTIGQFDASKYPEITLYVNVTDNSGKYVTNLKQADFTVTEDGKPVTITGFAGIGEKRPVDIVFVFDTTGSMGEEIAGVVRTSIAFADSLVSKGRDYRLGLVTFSDRVLQVNHQDNTLTADAAEFKGWVSKLEANGGEGDQENDYAAIHRALQMSFRSEAQKIFILITDAPPHHTGDPPDDGQVFDDPVLNYQPTLDKLKAQNISLYAVTPNISEFTLLTAETGGRFYDIEHNPDFTGIIEGIGETLASQYRVTYTSPRPTYDGTRRDVQVSVGGAQAAQVYAEQHLVNIQSDCLVSLLCCFPLVGLLVIPLAAQAILRRAQASSSQLPPYVPPAQASEAPSDQQPVVCSKCGNALRVGARFCPVCGQPAQPPVEPSAPGLQPPGTNDPGSYSPAPTNCPNCGNFLRPGMKFCNVCGFKVNRQK